MSAKTFFVVCAALLVQSVVLACPGAPLPLCGGRGYSALSGGIVSSGVASASGGGLPVSISSPTTPSGISLLSQNSISGNLYASGEMPFLAAVALKGQVPSSGSAGTSYSCGDSNIGISGQTLSAAGISASNAGYGSAFGARRLGGCSCGRGIY
ncbi:chorion class B protein M2410-like [Pectinophora gossypiella]|uniref:chorion class B protein M2410-like n=1 Tax=Pectinophora gossypiella TaxID=13191 RepID=UPI00214F502E|nr:chorion class B protein M2410-like [Pectinophora gossypiella]